MFPSRNKRKVNILDYNIRKKKMDIMLKLHINTGVFESVPVNPNVYVGFI